MKWVDVESGETPGECERVFITGMGKFGRFYADAEYEGGVYLLFDYEFDAYLHVCDGGPDHWMRIVPPERK